MSLDLYLSNIRCFKSLRASINPGLNYVYGPNGSGKTSLLEAISMFAPGKSLKGALVKNIIKDDEHLCRTEMSVESNGIEDIFKFVSEDGLKSEIKLNNSKISKVQIMEVLSISWLTPQIMFNFWKDLQVRRNLIDRLTSNFIPRHAEFCAQYEQIKNKRNLAIQDKITDPIFFNSVERIMVDCGVKILQNRADFVERINLLLSKNTLSKSIKLNLKGRLESSSDQMADWAKEMKFNRYTPSSMGPNRTEIEIDFDGRTAKEISTGEQQLCLILLIFMALDVIQNQTKILLLDDIFANLDLDNVNVLMNFLHNTKNTDYVLISHTKQIDFAKCNYIDICQIKQKSIDK